jgi:ankyrin repeat protein
MQRTLPARPSLDRLRHEAKDLLKLRRAGDLEATARFVSAHPRIALRRDATNVSLSDAQFVLAREYGFASWPKLKAHVDGLQHVEERVVWLRQAFANADRETRERLLSCVHSRARFQDYNANATELSERDARLVVANEEGYAFWSKYESYLYLDPTVQQVIAAARHGELATLQGLLRADPGAANPRWVPGRTPERISNDSIPLNCLAEGVFNGTNKRGNDYQLAQALIRAGADIDIDNGGPLKTAVSYYAAGGVRALLEAGAAVDSPDGSGMPMAYALTFGFSEIAELLARFGAQLDLRFAAGLGKLDALRSFVNPDGSLKPDAGRLADPYENRFRCERTRANILCQALYFACIHARSEAAEFLLELGADVNQEVPGVNQLGGTILHALTAGVPFGASANSHMSNEHRVPLIELVLRHGASVTMRDTRFQSTPLGWANYHGATSIFDMLAPHAGVHDAVQFGLLDRLHDLLDLDPALANARDELGQTPLHCLNAEAPHVQEIMELLLARGANPDALDNAGQTAYDKVQSAAGSSFTERLRQAIGPERRA